jgi:flagellar biosynthetic protein FliQ
MTPDILKEIFLNFFMTILMAAGPVLLVSLVVGLVISFFQAITQIQEFTLTFVPKIVAVFLCFYIMMPWMARILTEYTTQLIEHIPTYIR